MSEQAMRFTVDKDLHVGPRSVCDACAQPLKGGERVYMLMHLATPWKAEDDEDNDWSGYTWHVGCDEGSLAALVTFGVSNR
jgi:hypothetical protein